MSASSNHLKDMSSLRCSWHYWHMMMKIKENLARPLIDVSIKNAYPLLRIDESLSRFENARVFSSIDLA